MKIAIIADTHDNLANIKRIVGWLNKPSLPNSPAGEWCEGEEKINLLLHCGDISNKETLNEITRTFNGEVKFVRGNADHDLENLQEVEEIEVGGKKIAFTHFLEKAEDLAATGKYDLVFYGHTHRPWFTRLNFAKQNFGGRGKVGDCRLINPGEVAGQFYKPTFAVYNALNDKLELKILEKLEGCQK